jgi:hypothetical protein
MGRVKLAAPFALVDLNESITRLYWDTPVQLEGLVVNTFYELRALLPPTRTRGTVTARPLNPDDYTRKHLVIYARPALSLPSTPLLDVAYFCPNKHIVLAPPRLERGETRLGEPCFRAYCTECNYLLVSLPGNRPPREPALL